MIVEELESRLLLAISFGDPILIATAPAGAVSAVAGDFDGDGKLDLAVGSADGTVSVLPGDGQGGFGLPISTTAGTSAPALAVADFNHDGKLDLAVGHSDENCVTILLGNGDGTFAAVDAATQGASTSVAVGDFNGDGRIDVACANGVTGVNIICGNSAGGFWPASFVATGDAVSLTRMRTGYASTQDSIVVANAAAGTVVLIEGLSVRARFSVANPTFVGFIETGRVIVLSDHKQFYTVFGAFQQLVASADCSADAVVVAEFSGDRTPDIVAADSSGDLNFANGANYPQTYFRAVTPPQAAGGGLLAAGCFDGDWINDLVMAGADGRMYILLNETLAVKISLPPTQEGETQNPVVHFTVQFSHDVVDFTPDKLSYYEYRDYMVATVTGSGSLYEVAVSGMCCLYLTVGIFLPWNAVHDSSGRPNEDSRSVPLVDYHNPLDPGILTPPAAKVGEPSDEQVLFHFTDDNADAQADDYTATISWGDGTTSTVTATPGPDGRIVPSAGGGFDVLGSHTYQEVLYHGHFNVDVTRDDGTRTRGDYLVTFNVFGEPVVVSVADTQAAEDEGSAIFTASIAAPVPFPVHVTFMTQDGTALSPSDYGYQLDGIDIPAGQTTGRISIPIVNDLVYDPDELFTLRYTGFGDGVLLDWKVATCTIIDDEYPSLTVDDKSVLEGDSGESLAVFTLTLSAPSSMVISVDAYTLAGEAVAGEDFESWSGTVTFGPGVVTQTVQVPVVGDAIDESNETFSLVLGNPSNVNITRAAGVCTIFDNDPLPSVSIADTSVVEGGAGTRAVFTITLSAPSGREVIVTAATRAGSATTSADFANQIYAVVFCAGETSKTFAVPILDDLIDELDEIFYLSVSAFSNATIDRGRATCTIIDDDPEPSVSVADVSAVEGDGSTTAAVFTLTLSAPSGKTIILNAATRSGSATGGGDFLPWSGTVTFEPGQTSKTITVLVVGDTVMEPDEAFYLDITGSTNADIATATATCTITDGDSEILAFDSKTPATYIDSDGNPVTVRMSGPGRGEVRTMYGRSGIVHDVAIFDSTDRTKVRVIGDPGRHLPTTVRDIIVRGSVGKLVTSDTQVLGDVTISGSAGLISVWDAEGAGRISVGSATRKGQKLTLDLQRDVIDLSVVSQMPIKAITAAGWQSWDGIADSITAPHIDSIAVGNRYGGDFEADINILGSDRGVSLDKLRVRGMIRGSTVSTAGTISSVITGGAISSNFLAGIADSALEHAVSASDFVAAGAAIRSFKIVNIDEHWRRQLEDTNLSAATLGTLRLQNADLSQCGLWALGGGDHPAIGLVTNVDTSSGLGWRYSPRSPLQAPPDLIHIF